MLLLPGRAPLASGASQPGRPRCVTAPLHGTRPGKATALPAGLASQESRRPRKTPAEPRVLGHQAGHEGRGLLCRGLGAGGVVQEPDTSLRAGFVTRLGTGLRAGIRVWGQRERRRRQQLPRLNIVQSKAHGLKFGIRLYTLLINRG